MKHLLAWVLCVALPATLYGADSAFKVSYDGGSIQQIKSGTSLKLYIEPKQIRLVKDKADVMTIQASSITDISYGQDVHRRIGAAIGIGVFTLGIGALMALTKSKKHFIGLTWAEGDQKGGLAMQCDKDEYRGILTGIEGISGKKAVDSTTLSVKN